MTDLKAGDRVRVRRDPSFEGPWPAEPVGTITPWPILPGSVMPVVEPGQLVVLVDHEWAGRRQHRAYWVQFDEAQYDTEGDGPFRFAEIWEMYLEPIAEE